MHTHTTSIYIYFNLNLECRFYILEITCGMCISESGLLCLLHDFYFHSLSNTCQDLFLVYSWIKFCRLHVLQCLCSCADRRLNWVHFLAIVNNGTINTYMQISGLESFRYGLYGHMIVVGVIFILISVVTT